MILAEKIIKLRKQFGWSQEELAEKMDVSRQSVSKWESTASIPDLNKIILLSEIFSVSTDFLLKDDLEVDDTFSEDKEPGVLKVSLEVANNFCNTKIKMSKYVSIGVFLSICSVVPLLFLLALAEGKEPYLSMNLSTALGLTSLFVMISIAVSLFLRSNQNEKGYIDLEKNNFELAYGVHSVFKERVDNFKGVYTKRVSICISMIIISVVPLIVVSMYTNSDMIILFMVVLMMVTIGTATSFMIPVVIEHNAYTLVIGEGEFSPIKKNEAKRSEKVAAFYWPLVTAIYIGWSLWTMDWHITWIIWPVAGISFAGIVGLVNLLAKES